MPINRLRTKHSAGTMKYLPDMPSSGTDSVVLSKLTDMSLSGTNSVVLSSLKLKYYDK